MSPWYHVAMQPAQDIEILIPEKLPFLESISWFDRNYRDLQPLDMLRRYESGWRNLGVLADPSPEEWSFIRELVKRFGSYLDVRDLGE
jgi:hypothetical protein